MDWLFVHDWLRLNKSQLYKILTEKMTIKMRKVFKFVKPVSHLSVWQITNCVVNKKGIMVWILIFYSVIKYETIPTWKTKPTKHCNIQMYQLKWIIFLVLQIKNWSPVFQCFNYQICFVQFFQLNVLKFTS